jgi:arylsulfatase A
MPSNAPVGCGQARRAELGGHLPQGEVRSQVAQGCDWLPTIAELCGVATTKAPIDGKNLVPVIRSADAPTPHDVLHWQFESSWAVRDGDWKLLHDVLDTTRRAPGERIGGSFLVNLHDDPSETTNLTASHPDVVARLERLRAEWSSTIGH